jgi:hypothetical protein
MLPVFLNTDYTPSADIWIPRQDSSSFGYKTKLSFTLITLTIVRVVIAQLCAQQGRVYAFVHR